MSNPHRVLSVFVLLLLSFFAAVEASAQSTFQISFGPLFTVDSTADSNDVNVGNGVCADADGRCTLRAAIEESNYEPVANVASINIIIFALPQPAVIELTRGELTITAGVWIFGPGARRLTVQRSSDPGTAAFRIFHIAAGNGGVEIRRLSIRNGNAGSGNGGGILVEENSGLSLKDLAITENSAANGGGIANASRSFFAERLLISSNTAVANGGGIFSQVSLLFSGPRVSNSTITNNSAASGGAIYNSGGIYLVNNTISSNTATAAASSIFNGSGSAVLLNTIVGRDEPAVATALSGSFTSKGNNVVTDARGSTGLTNGVNGDQVSDNNAIDPLLGPLADNGGHTDTRALLADSPAINAGSDCVLNDSCSELIRLNLSSDQRGRYSRKAGSAVDVGAYEAGSGPPLETVSFGLLPGPGRPALFSGAVAVLTSVTTGEKHYAAVNPFGGRRFQNIATDFYILETRAKRALASGGVFPLALDEVLPSAQNLRTEPDAVESFRLIIESSKPKLK